MNDRLRATASTIAFTLLAILTALIVGGLVIIFSDPDTLITWGANYAPRTTNGEWWRLCSAMFVHQGAVAVLVNAAAIVQLGFILERLVGRTRWPASI